MHFIQCVLALQQNLSSTVHRIISNPKYAMWFTYELYLFHTFEFLVCVAVFKLDISKPLDAAMTNIYTIRVCVCAMYGFR